MADLHVGDWLGLQCDVGVAWEGHMASPQVRHLYSSES